MKRHIPKPLMRQILSHAEKDYPKECCGLILGLEQDPSDLSSVIKCQNVQNIYHQKDPGNFPRTARTAYFMEPLELLAIQKSARENGRQIRVIYHSHIDANARFSEEDKHLALYDNEPVYPGVSYLVVSVAQGKTKQCQLFSWNPDSKDFVIQRP